MSEVPKILVGVQGMYVYMCVCVCVCARARVWCVCVCNNVISIYPQYSSFYLLFLCLQFFYILKVLIL